MWYCGGCDRPGRAKEEMGAAATSPSTSTARPCRPLLAHGCPLLELLSMRASGRDARRRPPPYGTVSVHDGRRRQIVYCRLRDSLGRARQVQGSMILLPLTGPHRAISAEGRVSVTLDLHDGAASALLRRHEAAVLLWDAYGPDPPYDTPITRTVATRYGRAEVTYIVLGNAVQGAVQVRLLARHRDIIWGAGAAGCVVVHGRIAARAATTTYSPEAVVVVLFDCEGASCARGAEEAAAIVPLARSIVAAPVKHPLAIEVHLRAASGEEIVRGSLKFFPKLDGERHVQRLAGANGVDAEVTVSWSE